MAEPTETHLPWQTAHLKLILGGVLPEHYFCFMNETSAQAQFMVHGSNETKGRFTFASESWTPQWATLLLLSLAVNSHHLLAESLQRANALKIALCSHNSLFSLACVAT